MVLYYIDTCIWRDYCENRSDNFRPLGEWALRLFNKIIKEKSKIVYSECVEKELYLDLTQMQIEELFEIFPESMILKINLKQEYFDEAKVISRKYHIPFMDAVHVVLAKTCGAILITRDKHMEEAQHIITIKKPEDLL